MSLHSTFSESVDPALKRYNSTMFVDLNKVFRDALEQSQKENQVGKIILRCEYLPFIRGEEVYLSGLFLNIIQMILRSCTERSKLFLYVACEEEKDHSTVRQEGKNYRIDFHTNITTSANWKESNSQIIKECENFLSTIGGWLFVHNIDQAGCLFSIRLAGKLF